MDELLGLPLAQAEALCRAAGLPVRVVYTADPRQAGRDPRPGTLRVVRARPGELTAAHFPDGDPAEETPGPGQGQA